MLKQVLEFDLTKELTNVPLLEVHEFEDPYKIELMIPKYLCEGVSSVELVNRKSYRDSNDYSVLLEVIDDNKKVHFFIVDSLPFKTKTRSIINITNYHKPFSVFTWYVNTREKVERFRQRYYGRSVINQ